MFTIHDRSLHPNKSEHRRLFESLRTLILTAVTSAGSQRWLSAKHLPYADAFYRAMESQIHKVRLEMDSDTYTNLGHLIKRKVDNWVDGVTFRYVKSSSFRGLEVSWTGQLKRHRWV